MLGSNRVGRFGVSGRPVQRTTLDDTTTYDETDEGTVMTESNEAPWYDTLSLADKAQYRTRVNALIADLHKAAEFLRDNGNARAFPVRSYQPEVDLQYFVNEADADARGDFEKLAANVLAAGGEKYDRGDVETGSVQHIAELRFGSGRVAYRVVWIERTPTDG